MLQTSVDMYPAMVDCSLDTVAAVLPRKRDVMSLLQAQGLSRNKGIFMSGDTETKEAGIILFYLCI